MKKQATLFPEKEITVVTELDLKEAKTLAEQTEQQSRVTA